MRVAVVGASHWHLRLYLKPLLARDDVVVVGIADPDEAFARELGHELACAWSTDYRSLCDEVKPHFVVALGRHADMAEEASYLIDAGIPFAIEKPAGLGAGEIDQIATQADTAGAFAAVPFVFRQSDLVARMRERSGEDRFDYLSFTMIGRPPQQYERQGNAWMLDRTLAGGGALVNLGIHFLDLVPYLLGEDVQVVGAAVSSAAWGYPIEDFAQVTLRGGDSIAAIQTGYVYTSPNEYMDLHFSVRSASAYYVVRDPHHLEVSTPDGAFERLEVPTTNIDYYPRFIDDVLDRVRREQPPVADLRDAAAAMHLVEDVYAMAAATHA